MLVKKVEPSVSPEPSKQLQYNVSLHRKKTAVHVILLAENEYSAIELFDSLKKSVENGAFNLSASTGAIKGL
jgi:hypothetical protein